MPVKILMPALSPTMTEGNLAKWVVKEGDTVESGDVIAEIETDKATMEVEAVEEGVIAQILVSEGTENVPVNEMIAVLLEEGESNDDIAPFLASSGDAAAPKVSASKNEEPKTMTEPAQSAPVTAPPPPQAAAPAPVANGSGERIFASPLARRIAADKNIDLSSIAGSGPKGRIVKADLDGASATVAPAATTQAQPAPKAAAPQAATASSAALPSSGPDAKALADAYGMPYEEVPNNNMRKIVAKRLLESKQTVPHFYLTVECQIDKLLKTRKEMNEAAAGDYKLSVNDFIIKCVANAMQAYPAVNVSWTDDAILQYKHSDVSVAVATPNGLITPIVKQAETKGLRQISEEVKDMAGRAREGRLAPEEFQGGTFSVSNLGMFGVQEFDAIINPPQSCILAIGAGAQQPYVKDGSVQIGTFMKCTLSVDHRSVDGAVGAEFLQVFKRYIENPMSMLL
jgi:pyruvate dehydrogenase E2 component (dihydrolipoamide acetyltransferase)